MERRVTRSEEPRKALTLFLLSARKKLGVHALAVSTPSGWLVAGSGDGAILVAALGATRSRDDVATTRVTVGEDQYVVASLPAQTLDDVSDGVRRILS